MHSAAIAGVRAPRCRCINIRPGCLRARPCLSLTTGRKAPDNRSPSRRSAWRSGADPCLWPYAETGVLRGGQHPAEATSYPHLHVSLCTGPNCTAAIPPAHSSNRVNWGVPPQAPGRQLCLCPASILSPSSKMMAPLGAEPQLRAKRKSSGRTRRRSSTSCCGSHGSSSTRAQKRVW